MSDLKLCKGSPVSGRSCQNGWHFNQLTSYFTPKNLNIINLKCWESGQKMVIKLSWFLDFATVSLLLGRSWLSDQPFTPKNLTSYSKKTSMYQPPIVLRRQLQYFFSISYQLPMSIWRQFQYIFSISYQPPMVLCRQIPYAILITIPSWAN